MKMKKKKIDFKAQDKETNTIKNVGYALLEEETEEQNAKLYFYGDIVSESWYSDWDNDARCPQEIADFLNEIDSNKDIDIYFNSCGGDATAGIAIANILLRHNGKKIAHVDALAASTASFILCACDEIEIGIGAQVMIHDPWCYAAGNAQDFQRYIEQLNQCKENIIDFYMRHAAEGVTREDFSNMMTEEKWIGTSDIENIFDFKVNENSIAPAAATSGLLDRYKHVPNTLKNRKKDDTDVKEIVDRVVSELEAKEQKKLQAREREKQKLLASL